MEELRELLAERPFKPIRLVMTSGKTYEVLHPEMVMLLKNDILVGVDGSDDLPEWFRICPLFHVSTIESASAPRE
jgi:hypothetical protein